MRWPICSFCFALALLELYKILLGISARPSRHGPYVRTRYVEWPSKNDDEAWFVKQDGAVLQTISRSKASS